MKTTSMKTRMIAALLVFFLMGTATSIWAKPPAWAPAHGYKAKTRYIYFPQQNIYYDLKTNRYIYPNNNSWVFGANLPSIFGSGNLVSARQVELDYYNSKPYIYNKKHVVIYDSPAKVKVVNVKPGNGNKYYQKGASGNGNSHGKGKGSKK